MEKLPVIGLLGKAKVGKDTAGQMLCQMVGHKHGMSFAFADKLKEICGELYGLTHDEMYTDEGKARFVGEKVNAKDQKVGRLARTRCPECGSFKVETFASDRTSMASCKLCGTTGEVALFQSFWRNREVLQHIGTEGFRTVDPSVWVNYLFQKIEGAMGRGLQYAVITDCRFRSEAEAVWAKGGEVWRIRRPEVEKEQVGIKGHASEVEQDSIKDDECQAVIQNDSTLETFRGRLAVPFKRFMSTL